MKPTQSKLVKKRQALLNQMAALPLVVQGSYLERYSTCARPNCACHRGQKHGPRSYLVIYQDQEQRQVYIPQAQREIIRQGINQHQQLLVIVKEITWINLQLMRASGRVAPRTRPGKKGIRHE